MPDPRTFAVREGLGFVEFHPARLEVRVSRERGYPGAGPGDPPGWVHSDLYREALRILDNEPAPDGMAIERVLDAGCGGGYGLRMLCDAGFDAYGVDSSGDAVAFSRALEPRACVAKAVLNILPYRDAFFEAAVCIEAIEHTGAQAAAFDELRRVLMPGALLIMSTPEASMFEPNPYHVRELKRDELRGLYEGAGFEDVEIREIKYMPGTMFAIGRAA